MSSREYAAPLRIEACHLRPLRHLFLAFILLAGLTVVLLPLPPWFGLVSLAGLLGLARNVWFKRCELGGPAVQLIWDTQRRWWWLEEGVEHQLQLCGDSFVSHRLCILHFRRVHGARHHGLILMPEGSGRRRYRQLLVRIRVGDPLAASSS